YCHHRKGPRAATIRGPLETGEQSQFPLRLLHPLHRIAAKDWARTNAAKLYKTLAHTGLLRTRSLRYACAPPTFSNTRSGLPVAPHVLPRRLLPALVRARAEPSRALQGNGSS